MQSFKLKYFVYWTVYLITGSPTSFGILIRNQASPIMCPRYKHLLVLLLLLHSNRQNFQPALTVERNYKILATLLHHPQSANLYSRPSAYLHS